MTNDDASDANFDPASKPLFRAHNSQVEISTVRSEAKSDSDFHPLSYQRQPPDATPDSDCNSQLY